MKGIILAGGSGTRLYPLTISVSKQLIPVYDKPMIYYPISILLLIGIREILIITRPNDQYLFKNLLADGATIGCSIKYQVQYSPDGLAEAFIIGEKFIGSDAVVLILGDNIFYGSGISKFLKRNINPCSGGVVFAYHVNDPERYGVVEFDCNYKVVSIEEKPKIPKSNFAISGLYFYDNQVVKFAKNLKPSFRGELEITDINKLYLEKSQLDVRILDRGIAWFDTGTFDSLHEASEFIKVIEKRQGFKIGCIEEIAYRKRFINKNQLKLSIKKYGKSTYGAYLNRLIT